MMKWYFSHTAINLLCSQEMKMSTNYVVSN